MALVRTASRFATYMGPRIVYCNLAYTCIYVCILTSKLYLMPCVVLWYIKQAVILLRVLIKIADA